MNRNYFLEETELTLDVVILLIAGLMMVMTGILLFPVTRGVVPYYENGVYGLVLFLFALQIILLGKTPFGDMKPSKPLFCIGLAAASAGIVTCFIPGIFSRFPAMLLFLCFTPGGAALLVHLFIAPDRFRVWARLGGLFHLLWTGCAAVYLLSMVIGVLILNQGLFSGAETAVTVLVFGGAILFLALVMKRMYMKYPAPKEKEGEAGVLSSDHSVILVTGIFMILLGVLLVPVSLGMLPFAASAQLGLLMVIMSLKMLSTGNTPIGAFRRTRLVVICGILFAALGIVSCIVPGILVPFLTLLIGVLNILGGFIGFRGMASGLLKKGRSPVPTALGRLHISQAVLNLLSVMFGLSMLLPGLIPAMATGLILAANGAVLLYLLHILKIIEEMSREAGRNSPEGKADGLAAHAEF
jgi:hypothetical protein